MTISSTLTRVVVLLTSVALALVLLLAVTAAARADGPTATDATDYVTHTVVSGDTLWDIAAQHAPEGADLRDVVFDVKRVNGLDSSTIQPGQVIRVPAP